MKKYTYLKVLTLLVILSNFSHAQTILEYERTTFTGTYQTITGPPGPSGDDYAENYNLPFTFYYVDHYYNQVRICTNGWVELGSTERPLSYSASLSNEDLFSIYEPNKTLAAWWDDISVINNPVTYTTLASAPNRVFVVQWKDVNSPLYSERLVNFQIRLYETTNIIEFWYGSVSGSATIENASFGIKDEIGGTGHFIDGPTGSTTIGTTNLNSYNNWPTVFYRFSPSPVNVVRPNGGEFFSIGYTDTIKWTSTVNNVMLEYSTDTGSSWNIIENSVPAVIGNYAWLVPNAPSENSLIRISDVSDPTVFDVSDNVFTISEPPVITVLPDSFNIVLNEGDSIESIIQLLNSGLGNLYYEISIENVGDQSQKLNNNSSINFSNMWKESFLKARENRNKNSKASLPVNKQTESVLPLIISDPAGDASIVDIIQIRGRSTTDSIQLEFVFETDFNAYDFSGFLGLDIDQNILTGILLPNGLYAQEVGCEYFVGLFGIAYNQIDVYDQFYSYIGSFPVVYDLKSFRFSIPLLFIGSDDGKMNIAAAVGTGSGPTDWIPDQGYGVLGGNLWLNVNPLSGTITTGNNEDISVKIKTDYIDGGEFYANILISSNDPLNRQVTIPIHLTVIGQPDLISTDSLNFGQAYVGYPESVQIELKNSGSVTLEVSDIQSSNSVFSIQGNTNFNIEPLGTYQLSVLFSPVLASIEQGTISIISNDLSSPEIINLMGEGIFPPLITVAPDSFFYDLNVGDSVITQLTIDNSNGLGELVYQISDRLVTGMTSKDINQKYLMQRQTNSENLNWFGIDPANFSKLNTESKIISKFSNRSNLNNSVMSLPLIVRDIIRDGGVADIQEIRGRIFNNNLEIEYVFKNGVNITDSLIAVLYLDTDRNPLTGNTDPVYAHDLGVEYYVDYFPIAFGNEIYIHEYSTGNSYTVPYIINGKTISYSIPLSILGNDDGEMDLLAVSGYQDLGALDWAPDTGHATLLKDVNWLNENPTSGVVPPGENMTIEIKANTSELIGGNYLAAIDVQSNDPVNPVVEIPFTLHLTGIPQISVLPNSLNFGETYIGYHNSLVLSIESTGTDLLSGNINSSNPQFVVLDSVFELPVGEVKSVEVQFHPDALGIVSAELTISSNASSIPITISLTGEGVIAPNLITNTGLLEFQAGTGDTLRSNFMIYNTGGSDLVVDVSDEVSSTTASERLFGAGNNMIYEINPDNGLIINSFPTPSFTGYYSAGLAFSGEYLFFTDPDHTSNIFVLDPETGNIITYFPTNSTYCDGLAYIDPYLYVRDNNNNSIKVLNPTNGNIVRVIYPQVYLYGGLDGGNNRLFASDGYTVYELNPQNGSVINSFYVNNGAYGLGFTGERLFTSISWAGIDEYDPNTGSFIRNISSTGYAGLAGGGKHDAKWLVENPENVTISAGDSVVINLSLITPSELGHYTADIILESNDPDLLITQLQVVLDVVTGVEEENSLPTLYSLYNNYPNPFNPTTTIKYDIPEQSYVTIKIYTIVGEEVATLLNEEQNAGRYQIQWNASELASGVYFYRLQAGQFSDTKKLILMK